MEKFCAEANAMKNHVKSNPISRKPQMGLFLYPKFDLSEILSEENRVFLFLGN